MLGVVAGVLPIHGVPGCHGSRPPGGPAPFASSPAAASRPASWAEALEAPGLPNLHRVSAELYRGAQPVAEGMRELERMGVKTVVNLRMAHSDEALLEGTSLVGVHIPVEPWDMDEDEVVRFLWVVRDQDRVPVFLHCRHGADRTGAFAAAYRIVVQGWDRQDALDEMTRGGFGFHAVWVGLPAWVRGFDLQALQRRVGHGGPHGPSPAQAE